VGTGAKIRDLEGPLAHPDFRILGISNDGQTIVAIDGGWQSAATAVVWNGANGKRIERPPGHEGAVTCIAYVPGGKLLASGSIDKTIGLWNAATGEHIRKLSVHNGKITAVAVSPDGKQVASSSDDGVTQLTNLADGTTVVQFVGPARGAR